VFLRRAAGAAAAVVAIAQAAGAAERDVAAGERVFRTQCMGCHSTEPERNRAGPTLHGVFGRVSGRVEGFDFSEAMREAGVEWDRETIDAFLEEPDAVVPGTKMVFWGLRPDDRRRVIAYLEAVTK
jgi:cytochrome c